MGERSAGKSQGAGLGSVRRIGAAMLDWLYPPRCLACEEEAAAPGGLCARCWREAPWLGTDACPRCGSPAGAGMDKATRAAFARLAPGTPWCVDCPRRETAWSHVRAAATYEGVARNLVLALKEGDRLDAARLMATQMARSAQDFVASHGEEAPVLVPIPLHWRRRLARRFNQSATLARRISEETGLPLALDTLRRTRATPRQTRLRGEERREGVQGAFRALPGATRLARRRVLLVDDVMTTGATLDAAAAALRAAGVAEVNGLVFARSSLADPVIGQEPRRAAHEVET